MKKHTLRIAITTLFAFSAITLWQSLTFDDNLFVWSNGDMAENYENLSFQYGGNIFAGMLFFDEIQDIDPIDITLDQQTITGCTEQVKWAYYNPARGNRLRPLDQATLSTLQIIDWSYYDLDMSWWLYTNCTDNPEAIYGHIHHTRQETEFDIIAWVRMNFDQNTYFSTFDHTLTINPSTLSANGYIFDTLGGIAQLSTWPITDNPICGNGIRETGEQCDDADTTNGDWCSTTCQIESWRTCSGQPSVCTQIPEPPTDSNEFNAWLQFPSSYTNTINTLWYIQANHPASYIISSWTQYNIAGTFNLSGTVDVLLTAWDGIKPIQTQFTSLENDEIVNHLTYITLDTVEPNITITSPQTETTITGSSTVQLTRTGSDDAAGVWEYHIQIDNEDGTVITYTTQNNERTTPNLSNGTYTITITVYDNAWNTSQETITITIAHNVEVNMADILAIENAQPDQVYTSSPVIIAWLPANYSSNISIDTGLLIINNEEVWTSGLVHNGDSIQIALQASSWYNQTVTSTVSIENITNTFSITTKESDNDEEHSSADYCPSRVMMAIIAKSIFDAYQNEPVEKVEAVLELLLEILEDELQILASHNNSSMYALQCFYDLMYEYLVEIRTDDGDNENIRYYTAPNGKQYVVEFLPDRQVYTSPNFVQPKFFATYQTFTHHIDTQNPSFISRDHIIDTSFQAVFHTAPNGKIYKIQKTNMWYMSYTFIAPRYFSTLQEIKTTINQNNQ